MHAYENRCNSTHCSDSDGSDGSDSSAIMLVTGIALVEWHRLVLCRKYMRVVGACKVTAQCDSSRLNNKNKCH